MRVLCYHSFTDFHAASPAYEYGVPPERLEQHLAAFSRWGYRFLTPSDWAETLRGSRPVGSHDLLITIDDGYADNLDVRHLFARYGVSPLLFVVAGEIGKASRWMNPPDIALLDLDGLRLLHRDGWLIGSHSVSHPFLTSLDDDSLERELVDSRAALVDSGLGPIEAIAYPHGLHDARVRAAARDAGYSVGFALESDEVASVPADPFHITRLEVLRSFSLPRLRMLLAAPGATARRALTVEHLAHRARRKLTRLLTP